MAKHILVVDDDIDIRTIIRCAFESDGYKVTLAENGMIALQKFDEVKPDIVILDIILPDISGIAVCLKIRAKSDIPIIFLSGKSDDIDRVIGLEIGANDYLTKPFNPRDLVERAKVILRMSETAVKDYTADPVVSDDRILNKEVMPKNDQSKVERIDRIRRMVNEDFVRISDTGDPWVILNLSHDVSWELVASKYEKYERFYRAENFQKLGDMELTRQALDIRRAVSRAVVQIESQIGDQSSEIVEDPVSILDIDLDAFAMGDIYFRDGLTYLRLGDFDESMVCFRRSCDHDPTRGIAHAYRTYTHFRQHMNDPRAVEDARKNMAQAVRLGPKDPDVCVLVARFHLKLKEFGMAENAILRVSKLDPDHPKLGKLRQRLVKLKKK